METFYRFLNLVTITISDDAAKGYFIPLTNQDSSIILDKLIKINKFWNTRDCVVVGDRHSLGIPSNKN